ncbi:MAG: hypothetical protein U9Q91_04275 [Candidatus Marinimicrobia bacterium]|nr:hypothetical protein [Candidatus Neomarinimicrobiota bacterium]
MSQKQLKLYHEIDRKFDILANAKAQLKNEFFGIDNIIDEIIELVSSWYLFPELQEKPLVVNLWGLTGVGKTALIKRLSDLIDFSNKYYSLDLGSNDFSVRSKLEDIYEYDNGFPVIIALDEFQYARTINQHMLEVDNAYSRVVWELIDSGKFQISRYYSHTDEIYELISKLKYIRRNGGISVKDGYVISRQQFFIKIINNKFRDYFKNMGGENDEDTQELMLIPQDFREDLYDGLKEYYESLEDLNNYLNTLNLSETIKFLYSVIDIVQSPKTIDCTKAIIFIMGNLDEAYTMSKNLSPDISADEFHDASLKINITNIKNALRSRFRSEQIARLGNIHIIYPALSKLTYQRIIQKELSMIADKYSNYTKIDVEFCPCIEELIFQEGVYPTQGTRPVFSSINQIITSQFGKIMIHIMKNRVDPNKMYFMVDGNEIHVNLYKDEMLLTTFNYKPILKLKDLKKNTHNDHQAIVSVHEAGHAVLSIVIYGIIPDSIYSVLSDSTQGAGLVSMNFEREYISKSELNSRVALFMGGYAAEMTIFGDMYITSGSEEDIEKATILINHMLKRAGFGEIPGAYHVKDASTNNFVHDEENKFKNITEEYLMSGLKLAVMVIENNKALLLKLAEYLNSHQKINKEEIKNLIKTIPITNDNNTIQFEDGYYKNCLIAQIQEMQKPDQFVKTPLLAQSIYEQK